MSSSSPTVLSCSTTAEFLSALPFLTGFHANDSLFLVAFRGRRADHVMRFDLPQPEQVPLPVFLDGLCELLRTRGTGSCRPAVVITCEQTFAEAGGPPHRRLVRRLRHRFEREGWELRDAAVVAPDGWAGLLGPHEQQLRRPLSEITSTAVRLQALQELGEPQHLSNLARLPTPDARRTAQVSAALAHLDARDDDVVGDGGADGGGGRDSDPGVARCGSRLDAQLIAIIRAVGSWVSDPNREPAPSLFAQLIRAAEQPGSWLALFLTSFIPAERVIELLQASDLALLTAQPLTSDSRWSVHDLILTLSAERPESEPLSRATSVFADVAAHAPAARRPGLLALLAALWWMRGLQSVAQDLVREAYALDPDLPVVRLTSALAEAPPSWCMHASECGEAEALRPE